ncbi:hypothetical protein LNKW23_45040 [Paralimibaculum aggregatum]|uniref:DUF202 domain-containing protein n=1 Tax=Paralimibaculum aggregatum TaxID=3036245 RepID=A0ABQ6LT91_9RHOB|nr:hypothetical protein [Limibaculum sp. NKW23]GMG85286.1 hypothetical protein LNKW23_45040 [Limibaculum sp. NKW23]
MPESLPDPARRSPEGDAIYIRIREEIQFELNLINARVNWLVASQAFLFVPLTIGAQGQGLRQSLFYPLVPLLGIAICLLVLVSISAALWRSRQWRRKCHGAYAAEAAPREFSIVQPVEPAIPFLGMVGAIGVPVVLALTWVYLLLAPPAVAMA